MAAPDPAPRAAPEPGPAAAPEPAPRQLYAGLVSRVTGLAVDAVVLTLGSLALATLPALAWERMTDRSPGWLSVLSAVLATALPWAYFTGCWWLTGRTAGGLLVGVAVRRVKGGPVSLPQAALRAAVGLLFAAVWVVGLVGVLTDERRRAWHDRLFRTVVCYAGPRRDR